jgi:Ribbon-helix-helix domain
VSIWGRDCLPPDYLFISLSFFANVGIAGFREFYSCLKLRNVDFILRLFGFRNLLLILSGESMTNATTTTRWTVSVSKDTDIAVRSFLAQRGMKKGDLSKFIEDAVKWRVLDQTMAEARGQFADLSPEALDTLLDEAVTAVRQADAPKAR